MKTAINRCVDAADCCWILECRMDVYSAHLLNNSLTTALVSHALSLSLSLSLSFHFSLIHFKAMPEVKILPVTYYLDQGNVIKILLSILTKGFNLSQLRANFLAIHVRFYILS